MTVNRWFETKVYIHGEYRATTVYWLPENSPLVEGENRKEVRRPIKAGEVFYFDDSPKGQKCINPWLENGWTDAKPTTKP